LTGTTNSRRNRPSWARPQGGDPRLGDRIAVQAPPEIAGYSNRLGPTPPTRSKTVISDLFPKAATIT